MGSFLFREICISLYEEVIFMITLLVILAILAIIGLTILAIAIGGIFAFGDVILAVVLIALIVKHFVKKYKKNK